MQLLDSLANQLPDIPESLQTSLQDIVHKVEIQSHHCITHLDFGSVEVPESIVSHFQQLSLDFQNKFLSHQLRSLLYAVYYNGSSPSLLSSNTKATNVALNENLENNTLFGVDIAFYDRLHESNKGVGYWNHDWLVLKEDIDGTLVVYKNGLRLHIEPDSLQQAANIGDSVAIKMPNNLVQNGFYMAIANAAMARNYQTLVRVYFNLTPEGSVAVMNDLTTQLNAISIAFSFKALYNPSDYGRYDSAVLYFDKKDYELVRPVLERVYRENQVHFQERVPLFTKFIAPGLAIAEEPDRKFGDQESFGTNRCQIVANGLLEAWYLGNHTPEDRMAAIVRHFSLWEIELQRPYLNANSDDIYTSLNL
ncbi:MAG: T3SS effector HopA1 family protein [Nostoc sp. ChiQUE02]|uniref:T3SS effector HopA1 family protein n=1 Tax=Nostoc sp. ChiQUE02 TaxID=3075377 RepID=UPI002AD1EF8F|nr:T3SS effector HopA1 family protein [Nostoc sp. ChiQUE02]MDZ8231193.1 T3SS effector HopA1 family protein [Nostoc sp. ChiQUE02]